MMPVRPRQVIGIFRALEPLRSALEALSAAGFVPGDVALLGGSNTIRAWGLPIDPAHRPEGDSTGAVLSRQPIDIPTESRVELLLRSGAPVQILAESAATAWADIVDRSLSRRHAEELSEWMNEGALALWATVADSDQERLASLLLLRFGDGPVQIHDLAEPSDRPMADGQRCVEK